MHFNTVLAGACLASLAAAAPTQTTKIPTKIVERNSNAVVTGAAKVPSINNQDGVGAGSTSYKYYSGDGSTGAGWPSKSQWASFEVQLSHCDLCIPSV